LRLNLGLLTVSKHLPVPPSGILILSTGFF
jgi:hypothetical protein